MTSQEPSAKARRVSERPADLTWRTPPRRDAGVADESAPATGHVPARSVPAGVQSTADRSAVGGRRDRLAVLPAASVDPHLLDQLTDHVIRQVERRIRIERERSGL
jgi:hypothetical protein